MRYRFIHEMEGQFCVTALCRAMQVTRSGYYAWRGREPCQRRKENEALLGRIGHFFELATSSSAVGRRMAAREYGGIYRKRASPAASTESPG